MPLYRAELLAKKPLWHGALIHDVSQALYLPFDYDDGSYARDRSGYNNHGTIYGATPVTGKIGMARSFDGTDDRVEVAGFQYPEFTLEAWIKLAAINRFHGIIGRAASIWSDVAFSFRVTSANRLSFVTSADGSTIHDLASTIALSANTWYHVAAVFKRPNKILYIDLVERGRATWDKDIHLSSADIIVGGYAYGVGLNYLMRGCIDELRFRSRGLSLAEISVDMYRRF